MPRPRDADAAGTTRNAPAPARAQGARGARRAPSTGRAAAARARIGISGWRYAPWRGEFYPAGLPQKRELEYAAERFSSIELNGSFYSLQRPESYARWYADVPDDFVFAVKGSRYITHMLRLGDVATALANFFASGLFELREKLGPLLWQLPPTFAFDAERLERFFGMLPRDAAAASKLARRHDARVEGRARLDADPGSRFRHAIEVRHRSFVQPAFVKLLRRHDIALVVADTAGKWPLMEDVTAGFVYVRLHGDKKIYESGYSDEVLDGWARRIRAWKAGGQAEDARTVSDAPPRRKARDVYVYFDNDVKVHAPFDAISLAAKLME
ncbi:MAG: DUF72 domain-containing protein [Gammaproteobacteria bacterium]|nr:DUF72 domain-containing protein [Gammaproteobacteria bacterium]